jgi:hypothetical protein
MKYEDAVQVRPRPCTAWSISLSDGTRKLALWHKDASILDVHAFCKARYTKFTIMEVDVGEVTLIAPYIMTANDQTYSSDGRQLDQDGNVVLHAPWEERLHG